MSFEDQRAPSALIRYPIEIEFPDVSRFAGGNSGIPYVFAFDSGLAGPHVMVNAITHGNEVCGAIVLAELLDRDVRPQKGRLTLSFANVAAYRSFNPDDPDASRCIDQDFNRLWDPSVLDDLSRDSVELRRARELRPMVDAADFLLDLHSMHERSAPLLLSGASIGRTAFARRLGTPSTIISDEGHPEGRRMIDYLGFDEPSSPKNALLIECGHHWASSSVTVAKDATARFLEMTGVVDAAAVLGDWMVPPPGSWRIIRVTSPVVATSLNFRFVKPFTGLELFPEKGTVIAWQDDRPIVTPYDDCVLVMPSLRHLRPGATVLRFGKVVEQSGPPR